MRIAAGRSTHDPDGNVLDLSQKNMANHRDIYTEVGSTLTPRHITHFGLRTMNADDVANFYRDLFELEARNREAGDRNHYLTDGHMTMVVMPWHITDFEGFGISTPAMDHIGFAVDSVDKLKSEIEEIIGANPWLAPSRDAGPEGTKRLELAQKSCPLHQYHFADVDCVPLGVAVR